MIDGRQLLSDLQPQLRALQEDLLTRSREVPELDRTLRDEWQQARAAERTAQAFEAWREDALAQAAVMWLLGCVFVRFLEDNRLIDPPSLAGPGDRLGLARDQHTLYFQQHPHDSDRDYLLHVFDTLSRLPGSGPLFDRRHNPVWTIGISGDAAGALLAFWQEVEPATGVLLRDFTDADWNTRFLGDLYQDLSESARKRYALLQTPDFVLQFILDRTLTPAIDEFGFREVRVIDPACGSGHFLLAAFERLFHVWSQQEPGRNPRDLAQRALAQVAGVDVNPFAAAIARFRLLLAALRASNVTRLSDAPAFAIDVAAGDSLLHGPRPGDQGRRQMFLDPDEDPIRHVYAAEDADDLRRILGRRYHVVVGNPPYIVVRDAALNRAYRERFGSCHRQYSLAVPFTERFFDLAVSPEGDEAGAAGYVGMITANSFMKREFGSKLIEEFMPRWDLTHVIDTSGAYIPGHGTPTVILFGRHQRPVADKVRAVLGIRGEPSTPDMPAEGKVWSAILSQVDQPGSSSEFVSVGDTPRATFHCHPWSIGGGGAAELKARLDDNASSRLVARIDAISSICITREDDAYLFDRSTLNRRGIPAGFQITSVEGESVRDWSIHDPTSAIFPYDAQLNPVEESEGVSVHRSLWPYKELLWRRKELGGDHRQLGRTWWEWNRFLAHRFQAPMSLTFAFVATHNHFVLDHGGKVFNRSAPVIKLPEGATEDDHLALLGQLNSSTACFWMKQVAQTKGSSGIGRGVYDEKWENFYEFTGSGLENFPLLASTIGLIDSARELGELGSSLAQLACDVGPHTTDPTRIKAEWLRAFSRIVAEQEELDWRCYELHGLVEADGSLLQPDPPPLRLGERAFEIVMARKLAAGELETAWFERHGSTPTTEIPKHWPQAYRDVVARRIETIEANAEIGLIEQPEYKRRWNVEPFEDQLQRALRSWLLDRLESPAYWPSVELTSVARLADAARRDDEFMRVAALYRGEDTFDVATLVEELVIDDSVPFLPVLRYRPTGRRKREVWEQTWALQRQEDAIDARVSLPEGDPERLSQEAADDLKRRQVGDIPVPPKYTSADFLSSTFWRLRGKLDVPKERFISYPHAERDADPTLVIGWAGWDHLQQAQALASHYVQMKDSEGWTPERLTPLLAGLLELVPWLKQWHNDPNNEYGTGMGDYYAGFVDGELRGLGKTVDEVRGWAPAARTSGRRRGSSGALS